MKPIGMISTTALLLLLGAVAPSYATQEPHEQDAKPEKKQEAKPPKQEPQAKPEKQQEPKATKQEPQAKPEKQQEPKAAKQQPQAKPEKQQEPKTAKQAPQAKPEKQQQAKVQQEQQAKPGNQQRPQRTAAAEQRQRSVPALRLSARSEVRIPDDRFRSNFGRDHYFAIGSPEIVGGYSRFQYSGFWFGFVQPWPDGWYYTDNVYVDYVDGGYFLFNPYYPGVRVSISVVN